jgi:hypothetical protein
MSTALRMMCYGAAADQLVEVLGMSESLIIECLPGYCDVIIESLGGMHMREPGGFQTLDSVSEEDWVVIR